MATHGLSSYGTVDGEVLGRVARLVAEHGNLGDVLGWGARSSPPRKPENVVTQDEYTHDVIMFFEAGVYVAYDVT